MRPVSNKPYDPFQSRLSSAIAAFILSLITHVLLVLALRDYDSDFKTADTDRLQPLEVRLLPSPPTAVPLPQPIPAVRSTPKIENKSATTSLKTSPPLASQNGDDTVPTKLIDIDEIRKGVGKIVNDIDQENDRLAVGQLRTKPLYGPDEDTPFARQIAEAGRPDCLAPAGLPGGLLAPLFLLVEKNGTGCKF